MRRLLRQIKRELKTAKHCAIYQEELSRVWPDDGNEREPQIARFAEDHGFRLRFYRDGLCAIFDKAPEREREKTLDQFIRTNLEAAVLVRIDLANVWPCRRRHGKPRLTRFGGLRITQPTTDALLAFRRWVATRAASNASQPVAIN